MLTLVSYCVEHSELSRRSQKEQTAPTLISRMRGAIRQGKTNMFLLRTQGVLDS
jgi:hypothetical protein